jgi:hypothetical protein
VPENVSIAYRGANYAIGQGPQFYGIWHAATLQSPPIEWWPLTPEGWSGAWARFATVEVPGTIAPVAQTVGQQRAASPTEAQQPAANGAATEAGAANPGTLASDRPSVTRTSRIAAAVLGLGVVLGIASLFPAYVAGSSLASQSPNLVTHVTYLAAWSLSAVLIVLGGGRMRAGALLGLGVSAVTLGLFVADAGTPIAGGAHPAGAGLWLGILGWLACTAGVLLALWAGLTTRDGNGVVARRGLARHLGRASSHEIVPLVTLVLAAVGAVIAFAPSWDSFRLTTANGVSQVVTAGNAFANPAPVIAGDVLVMAGLVAVVIVAALWRPIRLGGALVAGATVPMVAQAISAIVMLHGPTSPLEFGISQAQASQLGLTISAGLTPMFWVFCAFVATIILLCAWMLLSRDPAPQQASPYWAGPNSAAPAAAIGGADYSDAARLQPGSQ